MPQIQEERTAIPPIFERAAHERTAPAPLCVKGRSRVFPSDAGPVRADLCAHFIPRDVHCRPHAVGRTGCGVAGRESSAGRAGPAWSPRSTPRSSRAGQGLRDAPGPAGLRGRGSEGERGAAARRGPSPEPAGGH